MYNAWEFWHIVALRSPTIPAKQPTKFIVVFFAHGSILLLREKVYTLMSMRLTTSKLQIMELCFVYLVL
jgi:hypothetical protein